MHCEECAVLSAPAASACWARLAGSHLRGGMHVWVLLASSRKHGGQGHGGGERTAPEHLFQSTHEVVQGSLRTGTGPQNVA